MSKLYQYLKNNLNPCGLTGRKDEIKIRCPFCGDSTHDKFKTHLYIQNKSPYKFYCQRCNATGIANRQFLEKLNLNDYNIIKTLDKEQLDYQKKLSFKYGNELNYFKNKKINPYPNQIEALEAKKLIYLRDRMGIKLSTTDINKYKLILNLEDFFNNNNIDLNKRIKSNYQKELLFKFHNYCIGFLSIDKNLIIFRSLNKEKTNFRYYNYNIFPEIESSKKFYSITNNVDLSNKEYNIILTEGIFDIIGVYNHIYNKDDNNLYFASNGKSYMTVLEFLSNLSILNTNITVFSDNDVKINFFDYIMKNNRLAKFNGMTIYYNKKGKDFGSTKDSIELTNPIVL